MQIIDGRRCFQDDDVDCLAGDHRRGDRHVTPGRADREWSGTKWLLVCPEDDEPMVGRDADDRLVCDVCGLRAKDVR